MRYGSLRLVLILLCSCFLVIFSTNSYKTQEVYVEEEPEEDNSQYYSNEENVNYAQENSESLPQHYATLPPESFATTPAPSSCASAQNGPPSEYKFLLLLSTLDGQIIALDAANGGTQSWSLSTDNQPLLSSTLNDIQLVNNGETFRLIPSLDGTLYMYNSGLLQAVPMSTESLLQSSMRFGSDVIAGGKNLRTYGVNVVNGQVHYSCSMDGCANGEGARFNKDNLMIRRSTQTVRALDSLTGIERWNLTVGEHQLLYTTQPPTHASYEQKPQQYCNRQNCANLQDDDYQQKFDKNHQNTEWEEWWRTWENVAFRIVPPSGVVEAVDISKFDINDDQAPILWTVQLASPVSQAWEFRASRLNELSLFDPQVVPTLSFLNEEKSAQNDPETNSVVIRKNSDVESLLYMGTFNKDLYIIPSAQERRKLQQMIAAAAFDRAGNGLQHQHAGAQQIDLEAGGSQYQPYNALVPRQEGRLFLPSDLKPSKYRIPENEIDPSTDLCDFEGCPTCTSDEVNSLILRQQQSQYDNGWYLFQVRSKRTHWRNKISATKQKIKEVHNELIYWYPWLGSLGLILAILISTGACFALLSYRSRNLAGRVARNFSVPSFSSGDLQSSMTRSTRLTQSSDGAGPRVRKLMTEIGSQASLELTSPELSSQDSFTSRFLSDFQPTKCLGKGGFGIVFEARNRLDDVNYAVKRIALQNNKRAQEKVKREVKALAQLDHNGIVRYFQAWFETPPGGWQQQTDKDILSKCGCSASDSLHLSETTGETGMSGSISSKVGPSLNSSLASLMNNVGLKRLNSAKSTKTVNSTAVVKFSTDTADLRSAFWKNQKINNWTLNSVDIINSSSESTDEPSSVTSEENSNHRIPERTNMHSSLTADDSIVFAGSSQTSADEIAIPNNGGPSNVGGPFNDGSPSVKFLDEIDDVSVVAGDEESKKVLKVDTAVSTVTTPAALPQIYLYIQMQLCQEQSLSGWLKENNDEQSRQDTVLLYGWFAQIVEALQYVHDCGLMHRDLKPSNIFFAPNGNIKIGDFGLATAMLSDEAIQNGEINEIDQTLKTKRHTGLVGTQLYMSPEQAAGQPYTHKVDVFSMGLIFFEMLIPFGTQMERIRTLQDARNQKYPQQFQTEHSEQCDFVSWLTSREPSLRPECAEIREHAFLRDALASAAWTRTASRRNRTSSARQSSSSVQLSLGSASSSKDGS